MATKKRKNSAAKKQIKAASKKRGRKHDAGSKSGQIRELLKAGVKPVDIAKKVGCSLPLVYNVRSRGAAKRGPGRPKKAASRAPKMDGLDGILTAVKQSEQERASLRGALQRIRSVIDEALA